MSYVRKRYGRVRGRPVAMGGIAQAISTIAAMTGIAADVTYLRSHDAKRSVAPVPMGDAAATIGTIVSTVGIATDLATDPYLPETVCRVSQLKALNAGQKPGVCAETPMNRTGGVGLRKFVKPLRAYVYAEQHPWVYAAAVVGIVGVPMLIGYALAKGRK